MDLFSKYAYSCSYPLSKKSKAVTTFRVSTKVSDDFLKEINEKYPKFKIGFVVMNRGSEFLGDFLKNLEDKDIPHIYANAGDKRKTSPIERFNKTMRLYLEEFRIINGRINNKTLKKILYAYNNSQNISTGYAPIVILND